MSSFSGTVDVTTRIGKIWEDFPSTHGTEVPVIYRTHTTTGNNVTTGGTVGTHLYLKKGVENLSYLID
tara:strand:+ start:236 stop:439 length:204 start_codon:yes stop_codon:yes gene_type:complete